MATLTAGTSPSAEIAKWDGETGEKWVRHADSLDDMLAPFGEAVIKASGQPPAGPVLDVGCGAGALTLRLAEATGTAVGVDVSEPLLRLARSRANAAQSSAVFLLQDASRHRTALPYQVIASRFGVMFFDDPVEAFSRLRSATRSGARLAFSAWRDLDSNPWASLPVRLAEPLLGTRIPPPPIGKPGPFAFADRDGLATMLAEAGWSHIGIEEEHARIRLPGADEEEAAQFFVELGPMTRRLEEEGMRVDHLVSAVAAELSHDQYGGIALPGAAWIATARS